MIVDPHSVRSRLKHWGQWVQQPRKDVAKSTSPSGTLVDQRNAAGSYGSGIAYDIIVVDGESIQCPPDGGMGAMVEHRGRMVAHNIRCIETNKAIEQLPDQQRRVVVDTYVVQYREDLRTCREVARRLGKDESTVREALVAAHEKISRAIYGSFEIIVDRDEIEHQDEAA